MPRQARLDASGTLYHVMIRGIGKSNIADDRKDRQDFVSRVGDIASDAKTAIYAWALMTNHARILLRSGPKGVSTFMRRLSQGTPSPIISGILGVSTFFTYFRGDYE